MVRRMLVGAALCAALFAIDTQAAWAIYDWEPFDSEGPQIVTGTGPPNAQVELVQTTSARSSVSSEHTSSTGVFRLDNGSCNPGRPCQASGGNYNVVFYTDLDHANIWAPNSYARVDAETFSLPEVAGGTNPPSRSTKTINGPSSLPVFPTITGTVFGDPPAGGAPLAKVRVLMYDGQGRAYDTYNCQNCPFIGLTSSQANGTYSLKVPPGTWKLKYETYQVDNNFPVKWGEAFSGCASTVGSATSIGSGTVAPAITLGAACASSGSPPSTGGGGSGTGGTAGTGGTSGGGAAGTGASGTGTPAGTSTPKVSLAGKPKAVDGQLQLDMTVSGPGSVTARATTPQAKLSAKAKKNVEVARASVRAKRAGKVSLRLKPGKAGQKAIAKKGKLPVTITLTFKPASGATKTITKQATFKKKKKAKRRR